MVFYLTCWFPGRVRAAILGIFIIANPVTTVIGAPLSTQLLGTSVFGLAGWQTMFVVEGIPSIVFGIVVLWVLCDSPGKAKWLTERERDVLENAIARDHRSAVHTSWRAGLVSPVVWRFAALYTALMLAVYGFGFWAPQIIRELGNFTNTQVGWVLVIPYACATVAMILWGRHSDRTHERRWHLALPGVLGMLGFVCGGFAENVYVSIAAFSVGAIGIYSSLPLFWTVLTGHISGPAAAAGIALINSIGNLSGYFGPYLIGWLRDSTKGYSAGILLIAASLAVSAALGFALSRRPVEIATV